MKRLPPRSTQSGSSAASDVYKRQVLPAPGVLLRGIGGGPHGLYGLGACLGAAVKVKQAIGAAHFVDPRIFPVNVRIGKAPNERSREPGFLREGFPFRLEEFGLKWLAREVRRHEAPQLSLIHIRRCRRSTLCRSRWSPNQ